MFPLSLSNAHPHAAGMYIAGRWVFADRTDVIEVENPADETLIATIPNGTSEDAKYALEAAQKAQKNWRRLPPIQRARYVCALADKIADNREALARLVTLEQGKPFSHALEEIGGTEAFLRFAAENARRIEGDIIASDNENEEIHIRRHPYGVVVGLTAWNYPSALAARKLGPALVAGNSFVLLAHEITPLSGLALAQLADEIDLPAGVFNVVTGRGPVIGEAMVKSPLSNLITMTGSTRAGQEIFRSAADGVKVIRLELGGKAPFLVMEDADIDAAVRAAVIARYTNCGQICTCNERMYLHRSIADAFLEKFVKASQELTIGDPFQAVDLGPKVSRLERDKVADMVQRGVDDGAQVLLAGGVLEDGPYQKGHWLAPTVLEVDKNSNPAIQHEIFGPVAVAMRVDDFDHALNMANDTHYGLSAYLFTQNHQRLSRAPSLLNFGELYLNRANGEALQGFHNGWGMSGLGGEDGKYGFDGYMRKQTAYLNWG